MGNVLKIIITGLITTAVRIIGQLSIPAGEQTVLGPSVFAQNGTMPMVFCIYGVFAYSIIASMFLLIRDTLSGNRLLRVLNMVLHAPLSGPSIYGSLCLMWPLWIAHLPSLRTASPSWSWDCSWEHFSAMTDMVSRSGKKGCLTSFLFISVSACFISGRIVQYFVFDIYSSFAERPFETVIWCLITGAAISAVLTWLNGHVMTVL